MRKLFFLLFIPVLAYLTACDGHDKKHDYDSGVTNTDTTTQQIDLPIVSTVSAADITSTTALISGEVTSTGNATITAYGFVYSDTASTPTLSNATTVTITSDTASASSYTYTLSSLTSDKLYYYCAYATNSKGTAYGDVKSFTTSTAAETALAISSVSVSDITSTSAKFTADIIGTTSSTVESFGFVSYDTEPDPTIDNAVRLDVSSGSYSLDFSLTVTILYPDREFYFRAFVVTDKEVLYSDIKSFTTPE